MKRILSLLLANVISSHAADVTADTLTVNTQAVINGTAPTAVATGQVKIGGGQVAIGSNLKVGTSDNRTGTQVQVYSSLATWASSDSASTDIMAADYNYYNNGVSPTFGGTGIRWYGKTAAGTLAGSTLPYASSAMVIGQNAQRLLIGVNGLAPIHFFNAHGVSATLDATGNMNIGSTAPSNGARLVITASSATSNFLSFKDTNAAGRTWLMGPGVGTGNVNAFGFYDLSASALRWVVNNVGNVGIGTVSPTEKLAVAGTASVFSSAPNSAGVFQVVRVDIPGGQPANTGIVDQNQVAQFCNPNVAYRMGMYQNGDYWLQPSYKGDYSVNLNTILNPNGGNVGIGTGASPANKLTVNGTISAKEIKVTTTGADYVFEDGYELRSLAEVEQFITREKHLPEMMSAKAMQADGMPVSEVVTKQLAKIEELTLYAIAADRERQAQAEALALQAERLARLEQQVASVAVTNARLLQLLEKMAPSEQEGR